MPSSGHGHCTGGDCTGGGGPGGSIIPTSSKWVRYFPKGNEDDFKMIQVSHPDSPAYNRADPDFRDTTHPDYIAKLGDYEASSILIPIMTMHDAGFNEVKSSKHIIGHTVKCWFELMKFENPRFPDHHNLAAYNVRATEPW